MSVNVTMPALSPTMTTGTLAKWTIVPGDAVHAGDVIAEIETDKATMEVEAIEDGVVAQILVEAGSENVAVGTVIAVLAEAGESVDAVASTAVAPVQSDDTVPLAKKTPADPVTDARSEKPADQLTEPPTEPPTKPRVETETSPQKTSRIFATPLARRIAADRGIALDRLTGSGPHGRILRRDVEAAPALSTQASPVSVSATNVPVVAGASELVVNSQMRKSIASRLQDSKQQAPHFYLTIDCQIDESLTKISPKEQFIVAYEPIWAIGTGLIPNENEIKETHLHIKTKLSQHFNTDIPIYMVDRLMQKTVVK